MFYLSMHISLLCILNYGWCVLIDQGSILCGQSNIDVLGVDNCCDGHNPPDIHRYNFTSTGVEINFTTCFYNNVNEVFETKLRILQSDGATTYDTCDNGVSQGTMTNCNTCLDYYEIATLNLPIGSYYIDIEWDRYFFDPGLKAPFPYTLEMICPTTMAPNNQPSSIPTIAPSTISAEPTSSTTSNPSTSIPTMNASIINITLIFKILNESSLNATALIQTVENALTAYLILDVLQYDVIRKTNSLQIMLQIDDSSKIEKDALQKQIEDELNEKYPNGEVQLIGIEINGEKEKSPKSENQWKWWHFLIIVIFIICLILIFVLFYMKKHKLSKDTVTEQIEMKVSNDEDVVAAINSTKMGLSKVVSTSYKETLRKYDDGDVVQQINKTHYGAEESNKVHGDVYDNNNNKQNIEMQPLPAKIPPIVATDYGSTEGVGDLEAEEYSKDYQHKDTFRTDDNTLMDTVVDENISTP
eukprot:398767_1